MIHFFGNIATKVFAVQTAQEINPTDIEKLTWLFACPELVSGATQKPLASLDAFFIGPRAAMVTPWSTNATEITQNMGISLA